MMDERRKTIRRANDYALIEAYNRLKLQAGDEDGAMRKLARRAIRHHCTVQIARTGPSFTGGGDVWSPVTFSIKGRVLDLSLSGCSTFTKDTFEVGQTVGLGLSLEQVGEVRCKAIAKWAKALPEKGGYATGFQFQGLTGDDCRRVEAFLKRMEQTAGM